MWWGTPWSRCWLSVLVMVLSSGSIKADCEFPKNWHGGWFQSGVQQEVQINASHIDIKGKCLSKSGDDKYLLYHKQENCYRCMAIHVIHSKVFQYKETFCETDNPKNLDTLCYGITGDATLFSMFRKTPEVTPIPCPFKNGPFTFVYNKGFGDCDNPASKAEMCTDDSRMVLKHQACADTSTESNVEELVCLTSWKEGSTKYLVGKILQPNRRVYSDEDEYRCFIYQRFADNQYKIAQSGDATCNGLSSVMEGSKTISLKPVDNHHNRCKFPSWITDHHTWANLEHKKIYRFSQRNATLKILDDKPKPKPRFQYSFETVGIIVPQKQSSDMRVICHSILESVEHKRVQIVAHVTSGCDSGYVCMNFYKRDSNVIEVQQTDKYVENPDDACRNFDPTKTPYTTLITQTVHSKKCPHLGRYAIKEFLPKTIREKRETPGLDNNIMSNIPECMPYQYDSMAVGCTGSHELMEFKTSCHHQPIVSYTCHGNWHDNGTYYVITSPQSRKSSDNLKYCFIYTLQDGTPDGKNRGTTVMTLSSVSQSCHRDLSESDDKTWRAQLTFNGTCAEAESLNVSPILTPTILLLVVAVSSTLVLVLR